MRPEIAKGHRETTAAGYEIIDAWEQFAVRLKGGGLSKNTVAVYWSSVWGWPTRGGGVSPMH